MRRWEHLSTLMFIDIGSRWWLRQKNGQEIPAWKKGEPFASLAAYCNYMDEQGWEIVNVHYHDEHSTASLLFKRPYTNATG